MDWNGVSTLRDHAPFGLPANSTPVDDWDGLYGNVPHYFPLRPFLAGGTWAPRSAPALPTPLKLEVKRVGPMGQAGDQEQLLHFSVSGGSLRTPIQSGRRLRSSLGQQGSRLLILQ